MLTRVVDIVEGSGQDLEGASEVQEVELVVQGEEHINWLVVGHCTCLGGHLGQLGGGIGWGGWLRCCVKEERESQLSSSRQCTDDLDVVN